VNSCNYSSSEFNFQINRLPRRRSSAFSTNTFSDALNKSIIIRLSASTIVTVSRRFSNSRLTNAIAGIENGGLINLRIAAVARALRVTRYS